MAYSRRRAPAGRRRARRAVRAQRHQRQGARLLHGVSRAQRAVVKGFNRGGVEGEEGVKGLVFMQGLQLSNASMEAIVESDHRTMSAMCRFEHRKYR